MRPFILLLITLLTACWGSNAHIVEGTVLKISPPNEVILQHKEVPGLMPEMTMGFRVSEPALLDGLEPGDVVYARLIAASEAEGGWYLAEIRETGRTAALPESTTSDALNTVGPLRPGTSLPDMKLESTGQTPITVGAGQGIPTLVTFLYTTCPRPEFCPAMAKRLQSLQAKLKPGEARLVSITIDPQNDSVEVLKNYAALTAADTDLWYFARPSEDQLQVLARRAALTIDTGSGQEILHSLRTWVLDGNGKLIERYDDARFPEERVLQQLRTGTPAAPPGADGTVTPRQAD